MDSYTEASILAGQEKTYISGMMDDTDGWQLRVRELRVICLTS